MTTYTATVIVDASQSMSVTFDDTDMTAAEVLAEVVRRVGEHPDGGVSLCHQCAGELDVGDPGDIVSIYCENEDGEVTTVWSELDAPPVVDPLAELRSAVDRFHAAMRETSAELTTKMRELTAQLHSGRS